MNAKTAIPAAAPPPAPHPRLRREAWIAGGAILAGLILLPLMIYLAGRLTLGAYATGGLGAFLKDFYLGLFKGTPSIWCVVVGPYLFLSFFRGVLLVSRRYLSA